MLKQRVITALVLLAILLPALFYASTVPFTIVVLVLMAAGAWEWGRLNGLGQTGALVVGAGCVALCAASWALGWVDRSLTGVWVVGGGLWVLSAAWLLKTGVPGWPRIPAALRLGLIWIGAGVLWYYYGPIIGLSAGLIAGVSLAASAQNAKKAEPAKKTAATPAPKKADPALPLLWRNHN